MTSADAQGRLARLGPLDRHILQVTAVAGGKIGGTVLAGLEAGTLELTLKISGRGSDWTAWRYRGWVSLTGGEIPAGGFDHALRDIDLRLRLDGDGIDINRLGFRIQDSDVTLSGTLRNWAKSPRAHLEVESSQFDLDLLIPKGDRSPVRDFLEALAASGHVSANIEIRRGLYKALALTDLSGRVRIGDGVLAVPRVTGRSEGGEVVAHALVRLPKLQPADAEVSLRVTGLPFEQVEQVDLLRKKPFNPSIVRWFAAAAGALASRNRHRVACSSSAERTRSVAATAGSRTAARMPMVACSEPTVVWIITEADRSVTTVLLPDEY